MTSIKLNYIVNPKADSVADTLHGFLHQLPGPTVFHFDGTSDCRPRVFVTLLHGNEPSGMKALHRLIKQDFKPRVTTVFIVASVIAAKTAPEFSHRMLPGKRDLNRCFSPPYSDLQGKLAEAIKDYIKACEPECVIDIHNTSGSGPAFAVATEEDQASIALASHFVHRLIVTDIQLGSLMEQDLTCPVITLESGGAQDDEAHINAFAGVKSLLFSNKPFLPQQLVEVLKQPIRLELCDGVVLSFCEKVNNNCDVTIRQDIESFNFGTTPANTPLAWLSSDKGLDCFKLTGPNPVTKYFQLHKGVLSTIQPMKLFMVTTRADIAKSDCLFYFVSA